MNFLVRKNIYHGDLATRNVLLTDTLDTKISDFGLSRRLYVDINTSQALKRESQDKLPPLPIKWVALEVLLLHEYVPVKSDVWSYGVLTWEIFSCAKEPYGFGRLTTIPKSIQVLFMIKVSLLFVYN